MSLFLLTVWEKLKQWLVVAGVVIAAFAGAYFKGRSDGKAITKSEAQDDLLKNIETKKEIQDEVSRLDDDDLARRVRRWTIR